MQKKSHFSRRAALLCGGMVIGLLSATAVSAQAAPAAPEAASPAGTGDIIVTANRREEYAQKVGTSLTAIAPARLDEQNIRTAEDLGRLVPGLNATASTGTGVATIVIRGVGETDFSEHQEQPNATYTDGVYVASADAVGAPLFDIQRVEVLRGPQGTLFGRNATGGLIQYISNKPVAGFHAGIEGGIGERDLHRLQGFANFGNDVIAARIAGYYQYQRGVIENVSGPDRGNKQVYALRGEVLVKPTDTTKITLRADGFNQNGTAPGYKATPSYYGPNGATDVPPDLDVYGTGPGNDPYGYRNPYSGLKVDLSNPDKLDKRVRNVAATIEQELGDTATLTSITAYGHVKSLYMEDTDSGPIDEFDAGVVTHAHNFQEDLHVNGTLDRFRYTVGGYYLRIVDHSILSNTINDDFTGPVARGETNFGDYHVYTRSEAIYGQAEYDLSNKLTAIVGGRYSWDQLKINVFNQCTETIAGACEALYLAAPPPGSNTVIGYGPVTQKDNNGDWSGKVQLNYKPTDDILLYASASKGLKGAGFTAPIAFIPADTQLAFKPENLFAYEVGEKAQFFGKKLTLNSSAYYYHYKNLQSFLFTGITTAVINREANAYGGEIEATARPTPTWTINGAVAYNHFLIKDVPFAVGDQRPNNAPRLMLNWGIQKSVPLSDDLSLKLNYFGRRVSKVYYNIVNTDSVKAPAYVINDFGVRLESKKGWYAGLTVENAFNKRYQIGAFDVTFLGYILRQYGIPRTVSGTLGFKF